MTYTLRPLDELKMVMWMKILLMVVGGVVDPLTSSREGSLRFPSIDEVSYSNSKLGSED